MTDRKTPPPPLFSDHVASPGPIRRILILKLDHIGDLLVAAPALALLRNSFADAHITLICGPWNVGLAKRLKLADEVHAVNFFTAGLVGDVSVEARRRAVVETLVALELAPFDLAIDLRRDADTRTLLKLFPARYAAGFGDLATFNYLDVALATPVDLSGRGASSLRLAPADLDGGAGHAISDRGLHLTAYVGELAVEVRTDAVWPPSDDGIPDTRPLGAALWRVDVRAASDLPGEVGTFGDPQEVSREQMRFDGQWLDGEPWGRWSCASRSSVTFTFPDHQPVGGTERACAGSYLANPPHCHGVGQCCRRSGKPCVQHGRRRRHADGAKRGDAYPGSRHYRTALAARRTVSRAASP